MGGFGLGVRMKRMKRRMKRRRMKRDRGDGSMLLRCGWGGWMRVGMGRRVRGWVGRWMQRRTERRAERRKGGICFDLRVGDLVVASLSSLGKCEEEEEEEEEEDVFLGRTW